MQRLLEILVIAAVVLIIIFLIPFTLLVWEAYLD